MQIISDKTSAMKMSQPLIKDLEKGWKINFNTFECIKRNHSQWFSPYILYIKNKLPCQ